MARRAGAVVSGGAVLKAALAGAARRPVQTGGLSGIAGQNPYTPGELALLALAGLAVALAGALGPAIWAAVSRAATALRAE